MATLRLVVDARVVAEDTRGIGRYARAILRRLIARDDVELTLLAQGPFPWRARAAYARALRSSNFAVRSSAPRNADAIWHPANGTFFSSNLPSVATIHDAVPFRYPDPDPKRRSHAQEPFQRSAATASRVIAVSNFGGDEVHRWLDVPTDRIEVIEHGVESSFFPGDLSALPQELRDKSYFLFVGDPIAEPRKNFPALYEAYRLAWPHGDGPPIAVAGARAPELPGVIALGSLGDDLTGEVNETLRACYRGAIALTLASYHETFGMPMLEAMACGTPVLAALAGSLPEVGGGAALYASSDDVDAWAEMLRRIASDANLAQRLRAAGPEHAKLFSWERSTERHLRLFQSVAQ